MRSYGVEHVTSSPRYPQSNGQAKRTVQTVKRLLKKSKDPYLALLSYQSTPLPWCNLSPSELLMGRRLRTTLPQTVKQLIPPWPYLSEFKRADVQHKERLKRTSTTGTEFVICRNSQITRMSGCPLHMVPFQERSYLPPGPQGPMLWKRELDKSAGIAVIFTLCQNKNVQTDNQGDLRLRLEQVRSKPDLALE
jgi:hypothetical protein